MPIYEYDCMKCSERFSVLKSITSGKNETKCPQCGSDDLKKRMSSFCCSTGSGSSHSPSVPSGGFSGGG
ncbi:MAG: zinc ribbon domain-containing protein [Nitrospirae bacterium]|nr:zinc ribbon domain-containing protein [Nitrospirota bacterium]